MGKKIITQGGTFLNDAILRAFEIVSEREAVRPDIAGLMGAYGCALIAKEHYIEGRESSILSVEDAEKIEVDIRKARCGKCPNNCLLTINRFSNGTRFISGNRCERGLGASASSSTSLPNLYKYKYERLFQYEPIKDAKRGRVGIPRVLNMYENYPFWFTFFTCLGYEVVISDHSSKELYESGMETMPSESVCYPGKIVHGHIMNLIDKGVKFIFYPCIPYEHKEDEKGNNHYNCPIVTSYPEVIKANMDILSEKGITFMKPFLPIYDQKRMGDRLYEELSPLGIEKDEIRNALEKAYEEDECFKNDVRKKGEETLEYCRKNKITPIVLAGRPYHVDPEINHGIPELINSFGFAVVTEDSIRIWPKLKHQSVL